MGTAITLGETPINFEELFKGQLMEEDDEGVEDEPNSSTFVEDEKKRREFDAETKLEILAYAKETSTYKAGKKYGVSRRSVARWKEQEDKLREHAKIPIVSRSKRLPGAGRKLKDLDLENYLINYVNDKLDSNQPLTRKALMDEGFKYLREKEKTGQVNHIKCSHGWLERFILRQKLVPDGSKEGLLIRCYEDSEYIPTKESVLEEMMDPEQFLKMITGNKA